jgi:hypothetical protein
MDASQGASHPIPAYRKSTTAIRTPVCLKTCFATSSSRPSSDPSDPGPCSQSPGQLPPHPPQTL